MVGVVTIDPKAARALRRLADREQKARDAAYAAALAFREAVVEVKATGASLREIGDASGRSFARIHQITRGVSGPQNKGAARPRTTTGREQT